MSVHLARAAPRRPSADPIVPHQLWPHLSRDQQQQVRQVLIRVAQQVVAQAPSPFASEETTHDLPSQSESRPTQSPTS